MLFCPCTPWSTEESTLSAVHRRARVKFDEAADDLRPLSWLWSRFARIHYPEWGPPYSVCSDEQHNPTGALTTRVDIVT